MKHRMGNIHIGFYPVKLQYMLTLEHLYDGMHFESKAFLKLFLHGDARETQVEQCGYQYGQHNTQEDGKEEGEF